jgi:hypothetical protein
MSRPGSARDMVHIHITDSLPIQARALPFADRLEIRFGKAFPVALIVDRPALDRLAEAINTGRDELNGRVAAEVRGPADDIS